MASYPNPSRSSRSDRETALPPDDRVDPGPGTHPQAPDGHPPAGAKPDPGPRPVFRYASGWHLLLPLALLALLQWVCWRYEAREGKWTKVRMALAQANSFLRMEL